MSELTIKFADDKKTEFEKLFANFIESLKIAGQKIMEENPSYILVTLNGGLPLYDCLTIINKDLDNPEIVTYFPVSSKFKDSGKITNNCFENFLLEKLDQSDKMRKIMSLDEVLSGGSVGRLLNGYHYASRQVARRHLGKGTKQEEIDNEAKKIRERMPYKIVGLKEDRPGTIISKEYLAYVKEGTIIEVPTKRILTLDNRDVDAQIIEWAHPDTKGWKGGYWPLVKRFDIKPSYLDFLRNVAAYIGVNPETVGPKNLEKIRSDCAKYSKRPSKF